MVKNLQFWDNIVYGRLQRCKYGKNKEAILHFIYNYFFDNLTFWGSYTKLKRLEAIYTRYHLGIFQQLQGQEFKIWAFFEGLRSLRGPQKQERKNDNNPTMFWAKNKVKGNFIWKKIMDFLLFNKVFQNFIFFPNTNKKTLAS